MQHEVLPLHHQPRRTPARPMAPAARPSVNTASGSDSMLECRRAYRQTFCHGSWHVKQTAGAMLLVNLGLRMRIRYACLA